MLSAITGRRWRAKRAGSPLALSTIGSQAPRSRSRTRSRIATPPISISALSPPPMRRANPPASTSPRVRGHSIVMYRSLAPVLGAFLFHVGEVLIEHDAAFAGERDKALAARASDQGEVGLARKLDAPGGESRARDQDRNAHAHALDHHLGGEAAGGVEDRKSTRLNSSHLGISYAVFC